MSIKWGWHGPITEPPQMIKRNRASTLRQGFDWGYFMLRRRNDRRCSLMFLSNLQKTMVSASFSMKFMNRFDLSLNTNMVIMSYWRSKHCKSTARFLQFEWAKMTSSMRIGGDFPIVRCHGPWTAAPGCSVPNAPPSVSGTPPPPPEGLGPQALRGPWQRSWWCK